MKPSPRNSRWHTMYLGMLVSVALPCLQAQVTYTFGTGGDSFAMEFVVIGHPGNAADTTGLPNPAGSVPYVFKMGKHEVSRDMITKANNAGSLGTTLADLTTVGGNGPNRPATGITWFEAAAFVNWLNTSQGHAAAYNLSGSTLTPWTSGQAWQQGGENLYRHKDAYFFLPSDSEWYKAAYYNGLAGVYNDFPTGGNVPPTAVSGGTSPGTAVHSQPVAQGPADIADAGGLSPYGTMAQGGNVWEWMETASDGDNDSGGENRGVRGGWWVFDASYHSAILGADPTTPTFDNPSIGFRVAAVPEPATAAGALGAAAFGLVTLYRRRS